MTVPSEVSTRFPTEAIDTNQTDADNRQSGYIGHIDRDAAWVDLELAARLRLAIGRIGRRMRTQSGVGPTPSQVSALATIAKFGPLRIGDLASREGVTAPTMTRVVAALEQQGHFERASDPDDGRSSLIGLTTSGRELLDRLTEDRTAYLAHQLAALSSEERGSLEGALPALEALAAEDRC